MSSGTDEKLDRRDRRVSAARLALAVKRLRAETVGIELLAAEPIAIVGLGCRFPGGASNPEKYWEMLERGGDAIRRVPDGRWPEIKSGDVELPEFLNYGGYLDEIDGFDAAFFGITPREAQTIDPQQRLLLEVTWEALWNAGLQPEALSGMQVGVFAAIYNSDYARLLLNRAMEPAAPNAVGAAHSIAAGRISFLLNLKGPCISVDTACSSSLVAIHLACQSLRALECDMAISGGVSLKVLPDELLVLNRLGMLSKSSRCHTFDAKADGYVPGEGCGVIVLKRLADALRDGDPIRAVIRGTAINHDGRTTVLTAPSGLAHEAVIRQALKNAAVDADYVTYVESHGTGTSLGDPIELQALQSVYGETSPESESCVVGAVKTNLGHLEAAAGFAGLIKVVLAMEHESIPANLHFSRLNPQSFLEGTRLKIAEHPEAWPCGAQTRLAGVSSLGFSGTNAHLIVEEAPLVPRTGVALPAYEWQRKSYWLPAPAQIKQSIVAAPACVQGGPLAGSWLHSPFLRTKVFELVLNEHTLAYVESYLTTGQSALHVDVLVKLLLPIVKEALSVEAIKIFDAAMGEPPVLSVAKRVQVSVGDDRIEVVSETPEGWKTHLTAKYEAFNTEIEEDALFSDSVHESGSLKLVEQRIQKEAAAVMEMSEAALPLDVPLINLGLDSMMATDLRNRLQALVRQELSVTFAFDHSTIAEMAEEIDARLWAARTDTYSSIASDQAEEVEI